MKKRLFFLVMLLVALSTCLVSCKMTTEQLSVQAEEFNKSCPVEFSGLGNIISVTAEDSTLVYTVQLYAEQNSVDPTSDENTTEIRIDSLKTRPADVKAMLGGLLFQPVGGLVVKKRQDAYDPLTRMGGYLRIDIIAKDSTNITSVTFTAQEIDNQVKQYYNLSSFNGTAYDILLELHKAIKMLTAPIEYDNKIMLLSIDYDKQSYTTTFEVDDKKQSFDFDENVLHEQTYKHLLMEISGLNSIMEMFSVNKTKELLEACAETNRSMVFVYRSKLTAQQQKVVITNEELKRINEENSRITNEDEDVNDVTE